VLLVDDERLVRRGFRMILGSEPDIDVVGEAGDGHEALHANRTLAPDVILMDIRMPRLDGLEATRRLLVGDGDRPRVIVLTTFDLDEYVYAALRAGASGLLLKDAPEELITTIGVVADGGSIYAPAATRRVIEAFARVVAADDASQSVAQLTARELDVLRGIAAGRSNREIARTLGLSEHTAKTHVAHILGKLGLRDRVQAAVLAYEAGVVRPGDLSR